MHVNYISPHLSGKCMTHNSTVNQTCGHFHLWKAGNRPHLIGCMSVLTPGECVQSDGKVEKHFSSVRNHSGSVVTSYKKTLKTKQRKLYYLRHIANTKACCVIAVILSSHWTKCVYDCQKHKCSSSSTNGAWITIFSMYWQVKFFLGRLLSNTVNVSVETYAPINMTMMSACALTVVCKTISINWTRSVFLANTFNTWIGGGIHGTMINEGYFLLFSCFFFIYWNKKKMHKSVLRTSLLLLLKVSYFKFKKHCQPLCFWLPVSQSVLN